MSDIVVKRDDSGTFKRFEALLHEMADDDSVASILVLACDANGFTAEEVDPLLASLKKPIFGGVFPELIYSAEKLEKGSILVGLPLSPQIVTVPGLSDDDMDFDSFLEAQPQPSAAARTMFVWVDGLASRIGGLIDSLFHMYGLSMNFIGGGAGSLSFEQKPCIFTNQGLLQDSALLVILDAPSGVGVSHGWTSISGPYKVTESERNVIKTLNWQPAFDIYRTVVEEASGQKFTDENFFDLAKGHPFGINRLGDEKIVRDPIVLQEDGSLVCVGEVPVESHVDILSGNTVSLVNAARRALRFSQEDYQGDPDSTFTFFVDCISRVLFLEDEFNLELAAVYNRKQPLIGALTLGEIANSGKDYLEFYNKTAVMGILEV